MTVILIVAVLALVIVEPTRASGDYWITRAPIPVAFGVDGAATVNGQIYVFGQDGAGKPLTYAYDPSTNVWTAKAPIQALAGGYGIVASGNKIYAIGGVIGWDSNGLATASNANQMYDPSTNTWVIMAPMPTNRSQVQVATLNGKIYVIGGRTSGAYSTVGTTEVYDPSTNSWITSLSMQYPVVGAAIAALDGKIYVVGGQDEFNHPSPNVNFNQIYDSTSGSWTTGAALPSVVWRAVGASISGIHATPQVFVIGGLDDKSGSPLATNYIYNPNAKSWTTGAPFPTTHDYVTQTLALVNLDDSIYAIGGIAQANEGFYEITEQYIPTDYNGTVLPEQPIITPSLIPSSSPSESLSPSPSITEFQWWAIPAVLLIVATLVTLLIKWKKPALE